MQSTVHTVCTSLTLLIFSSTCFTYELYYLSSKTLCLVLKYNTFLKASRMISQIQNIYIASNMTNQQTFI